jgi:hypothetical protein
MRTIRYALGWEQRFLLALVVLNGLCGSSLWAGGPRLYSGMPLAGMNLGTRRSLSATVRPLNTSEQPFGYIPVSWSSWLPNALQLRVRVHNRPTRGFVYGFTYTVPMRFLAVLPVGTSLGLLGLTTWLRWGQGRSRRGDALRPPYVVCALPACPFRRRRALAHTYAAYLRHPPARVVVHEPCGGLRDRDTGRGPSRLPMNNR